MTKTLLCVSTGIRMWALNGYNLVDGYPKYIHKLGLPKKIRKIDAAVHIGDTGKTLLFTDEDYWRYYMNVSVITKFKRCLCTKQYSWTSKLTESFLPHVILYFINIVRGLFVSRSYDEATGTMDSGYPRSFEEDFPGMDDEVDAAVYHYGITKRQIQHFQCS